MTPSLGSTESFENLSRAFDKDLQFKAEEWARIHAMARRVASEDVWEVSPKPAFADEDLRSHVLQVERYFNLPHYAGRSVRLENTEAFADRLAGGLEELAIFADRLSLTWNTVAAPLSAQKRREWRGRVTLLRNYQKEARRKIDQFVSFETLIHTPNTGIPQQTAACRDELYKTLSETADALASVERAWSTYASRLVYPAPLEEVLAYIDQSRDRFRDSPGQHSSTFDAKKEDYVTAIALAYTSAADGDIPSELTIFELAPPSEMMNMTHVLGMAIAPAQSLSHWVAWSQNLLDVFEQFQLTSHRQGKAPRRTDVERMMALPHSMPSDVRSQASRVPELITTILKLQEKLDDLPTGRVRQMGLAGLTSNKASSARGPPALAGLGEAESSPAAESAPEARTDDGRVLSSPTDS